MHELGQETYHHMYTSVLSNLTTSPFRSMIKKQKQQKTTYDQFSWQLHKSSFIFWNSFFKIPKDFSKSHKED